MASSRAGMSLQRILLGLLLQLVVSLLQPGMRYADYITMGINSPFELSFLTVPAVGVIIGALFLTGFRSIYVDRADRGEAQRRRIGLALWFVVAAVISTVTTFAIAVATRFDFRVQYEYWPARAALDIGLAVFAGLSFLLTFYDVAKVQGRGIVLLATFLGAAGSGMRYAPILFSDVDPSIPAWILATLSIGLFLLQALILRAEVPRVTPRVTDILGSPPAR